MLVWVWSSAGGQDQYFIFYYFSTYSPFNSRTFFHLFLPRVEGHREVLLEHHPFVPLLFPLDLLHSPVLLLCHYRHFCRCQCSHHYHCHHNHRCRQRPCDLKRRGRQKTEYYQNVWKFDIVFEIVHEVYVFCGLLLLCITFLYMYILPSICFKTN